MPEQDEGDAGGAATQGSDIHYAFGLTCVISASFFKNLAGVFVRLVDEADGW